MAYGPKPVPRAVTRIEPQKKRRRPEVKVRMASDPPTPPSEDERDDSDDEVDLASALTTYAYADPDKKKPSKTDKKFGGRTSRFWFKMETIEQETQKLKDQFKPKVLEHIDHEVQTRLDQFKLEFPQELSVNITQVREFFLKEIAPLTLAASGGLTQSRDVVQQMIGSKVDSGMLTKFEQLVNRAAVLRLGLFVLKYFDLPEEHFSTLFGGNMKQENEMSQLMTMLKENMELPRQDPRGRVDGPSPHTPRRTGPKGS